MAAAENRVTFTVGLHDLTFPDSRRVFRGKTRRMNRTKDRPLTAVIRPRVRIDFSDNDLRFDLRCEACRRLV